MTGRKLDNDAAVGRMQLAERMRKSIHAALQENTSTGSETIPSSEMIPQGESVIASSETLLSSGLTSSETLPSSGLTGSETLPSSGLTGSEALPSSETTSYRLLIQGSSETLLGSETIPDKALLSSESLLDEALLSSETLPDKTLPSSESLPLLNGAYGHLIADEFFFATLDKGMYELLSPDNSSASMLFYWAFTNQKRSVLFITYSLVTEALHYARTRISRSIDRIRESRFFSVKATPKGVFIDLTLLVEEVKKIYSQPDHSPSSDSLPPFVSSSSYINNTTNLTRGSDSLPLIEQADLHVIADITTHYGFTGKDINPKLIDMIKKSYHDRGLVNIAHNMAYAKRNINNARSITAYLVKTLAEDYGASSLTFEDREKADKLVEIFKRVRNSKLDDLGAQELREMLYALGKVIAQDTPRNKCMSDLSKILERSNDLYEKFGGGTPRYRSF